MERSTKRNELFFPLPLDLIQQIISKQDRFVLLETQKPDRENHLSYLFSDPIAIITCFSLDKIAGAFGQLEQLLHQGYWAAGFLSYEMGYGWEDFRAKRRYSFPLIWMGIFKHPFIFNHLEGRFLDPLPDNLLKGKTNFSSAYQIKDINLNERLSEYVRNIKRIKDYIASGLTYQVNYTIKCRFEFQGSSFSLYKNLRNNQPVAYSAFIKDKQFNLLSFSPELFFRKNGRSITVRPMKGTISRGRTKQEDILQARRLRQSLKDRSENVMIVDLLRNDLGRVSEMGSVKVSKLYEVEKYKTLFQMTSTIKARLKQNISLYELFKSIFPSGSVTGAPKIRTMEIIKELEKQERRVYTGAVGFLRPNGDAAFNVAIRTLLLRRKSNEMGIGSGIVYDSDPGKEYKECELKALFFTQKRKQFQLIETMRWSKKTGFFLLRYHLERLKSSAEYFNFVFNERHIKEELSKTSKGFNSGFDYRIRLLLFFDGKVHITYGRIKEYRDKELPRVIFAKRRVNSQDMFFYHKTTNRQIYDREYKRAKRAGFFEAIFENEKDEITEGAISNIFIRKGKMYYTPPLNCGLLNGVYRRYFLDKNAQFVKQRIIKRQDLLEADAIYLTNAVRGMRQVRLF